MKNPNISFREEQTLAVVFSLFDELMADTLYNNKSIKEPRRSARNRRQLKRLVKEYLADILYRSKKDEPIKKISGRVRVSSFFLYEDEDDEIDVEDDDFDDVYIS
jgi:hypothetical protein